MTARKIAAEAGMSPGHISCHFASLDALLAAAYALASDDLRQAGTQLQADKASPAQKEAYSVAHDFGITCYPPVHRHNRRRG